MRTHEQQPWILPVPSRATGRPAPGRVVLVGAAARWAAAGPVPGPRALGGDSVVGFVDAGHPRSSSIGSRAGTWPSTPRPTRSRSSAASTGSTSWSTAPGPRTSCVAVSGQTGHARSGPESSQLINSDVSVHWVSVDARQTDLDAADRPRQIDATGRPSIGPNPDLAASALWGNSPGDV